MNNAQPRFFTLMADSGTDTSNKDLEVIYVRMLCDGEPINKFLTIIELSNGTADGVIESFERAMGKVGVNDWKNAFVSLGSDGASVYTVTILLLRDTVTASWRAYVRASFRIKDLLLNRHLESGLVFLSHSRTRS